jgi:hypothetical protein
MICPKCKSNALNEEKDMVICLNCGFKATLQEYHAWKDILERRPSRKKLIFHEGEFREDKETFDIAGAYKKIGDFFQDKYIQILIAVLLLVILFVILAS